MARAACACVFCVGGDLLRADAASNGPLLCLDERGSKLDSVAFSSELFTTLERGGSRATFVIGGAEGLPSAVRAAAASDAARGGSGGPLSLLSLSPLTFTHQMARVLLAEQIYRASEIRRGSKYHKK